MEKIKKIFSIVLPMLFLNVNSYAAETLFGSFTGTVKYAGIIIGVAIIALIIFIGYTTDKKQNEKPDKRSEQIYDGYEHYKRLQELPEEDFEIDQGINSQEFDSTGIINEGLNILDGENTVYEDDISSGEEESLYNSLNEYVEDREKNDDLIMEEIGGDNMIYDFNKSEENQPEEIIENDIISSVDESETMQEENLKEEISDFTFDTALDSYGENIETEEDNFQEEDEDETNIIEENSDFTFDIAPIVTEEFDLKEDEDQEESFNENLNEILEETEEFPIQTLESKVKKYTGKKIGKRVQEEPVIDNGLDIEEVSDYDDEDEDIGVPTFDELLKQSEEDENFETAGNFDFMAEMEENLKKHKETRIDKKTTTNKATTKKTTAKKTTTKKTTAKKTTTKKKKAE